MKRERLRSANYDLPDPPTKLAVAQVMLSMREARCGLRAIAIARHLGVVGARRAGNGAVKGSWSGRMSSALRVAPVLRGLVNDGLVRTHRDERGNTLYTLTLEGQRYSRGET